MNLLPVPDSAVSGIGQLEVHGAMLNFLVFTYFIRQNQKKKGLIH